MNLNSEVGIYLWCHSNNNTLINNTINNSNYFGIHLDSSSNNTLANNTFINDGLTVEDPYSNTVENNTVNGEPLAYLEDVSDFIVQNAGQVILLNCTNITVKNLNPSNTSIGVELWKSDDCKMADNIISNNLCGIYLAHLSNNALAENTANSNDWYGVSLEFNSNNNTIQGNTASNNLWGICLHESNNNTLYHNNFLNNAIRNAYDHSTNAWDSGSAGNYYSDYNGTDSDGDGTDSDGDGIGNDPHPIPGGESEDRYPLMQPWAGGTQQLGDLNGDDRIALADAAIALRIAVSGAHDNAADVSGDGCVTSLDALMILQATASTRVTLTCP